MKTKPDPKLYRCLFCNDATIYELIEHGYCKCCGNIPIEENERKKRKN